jgi:hypothetical protein
MATDNSVDRTSFIENSLVGTDPTKVLGAEQGPIITSLIASVSKGLQAFKVFNSNGIWNKEANTTHVFAIVTAGGGGSGSAQAVGGGNAAEGSGGGGGNTEIAFLDVTSTSSEVVAVGNGGLRGVIGGAQPTAGGQSSFGSFLTAFGGSGGTNGIPTTGNVTTPGGAGGGTGFGGQLSFEGCPGGYGRINGGIFEFHGTGGGSYFCPTIPANPDGVALNGIAYGGGASGTAALSASKIGGLGHEGVVVIYEYSL